MKGYFWKLRKSSMLRQLSKTKQLFLVVVNSGSKSIFKTLSLFLSSLPSYWLSFDLHMNITMMNIHVFIVQTLIINKIGKL